MTGRELKTSSDGGERRESLIGVQQRRLSLSPGEEGEMRSVKGKVFTKSARREERKQLKQDHQNRATHEKSLSPISWEG